MSGSPNTTEQTHLDLDALAAHFDATDASDLPWEEATDAVIERPELEQISLRLP